MIVWVLLSALLKTNGEIDVNTEIYSSSAACNEEADRKVDLHRAKSFIKGVSKEGKLIVTCDARRVQH